MSKIWNLKINAYRRWELSRLSQSRLQCKSVELEEYCDQIPWLEGTQTTFLKGLRHHRAEVRFQNAAAEFHCKHFFDNGRFIFGALCTAVHSTGAQSTFYANRTGFAFQAGEIYDIQVQWVPPPIRGKYASSESLLPVVILVTLHFEPLTFQRIKTFPKGWAASMWVVGKPEPIHRSTLREQAEIERNLRRIEAREWD